MVRRGDQHQERRDNNQRQDGGKGQAIDDGRRQRDPPLGRGRADGHLMVQKLDVQAKGDGQHAKDSGQRGQHHRAGPFAAGLKDRLDLGNAFAAQGDEGVDQHDVVVHHDPGQRDDPDAGHHHAERLAHDH